jgi:hypothetical protein
VCYYHNCCCFKFDLFPAIIHALVKKKKSGGGDGGERGSERIRGMGERANDYRIKAIKLIRRSVGELCLHSP